MQVVGTKGSFGWYLNRLFNGIGRWRFCHVCPVKTLLFNLRSFDLKTALKFPVYIYNNTEIFWLGKVVIDAERIERGMVRIGHWATRGRNPTKICRRGMTVFHGNVTIQGGTILEGGGTLEFGDSVVIGSGCLLTCERHMVFGDHVRVGYNTMFMDTDYHYVIDTETRKVHPTSADVVIGAGSWVASYCRVMKGAHLPKNSVVAGGSLLNKDFSAEAPCQIYVGTPAKPVKGNRRRVHNMKLQGELDKFFGEHPEATSHVVSGDGDLDEICFSNFWGSHDR